MAERPVWPIALAIFAAPLLAAAGDPPAIAPMVRPPNSAERAELEHIEDRIQTATAERRWGDAADLGRQALAIEERTDGPDHPEVAGTLALIAGWLSKQGRLADATPLYRRSLAIFEARLGGDHPATTTAVTSLAANLVALGKFQDAETLYRRALATIVARKGNDRRTAIAYSNLAYALGRQGRYVEARDPYTMALIESNAAANLDALGRPLEAEPLHRQALAVRIAVLGPQDPAVATSYNNLGINLDGQGRYADGRPAYVRALDIRTALAPDSLAAATSYNNAAHNLNRQGDYARAAPLYDKALALWRTLYGPAHPVTAIGLSNVAVNLERQGRAADAQPLFEQSLAIRLASLRPEHPDVATARLRLGQDLAAQNHFSDAEPYYAQAVASRRAAFPRDHPVIAEALTGQAMLFDAMGRGAEAVTAAREASAIATRRRLAFGAQSGPAPEGAEQADPLAGAYAALIRADWGRAAQAPSEAPGLRSEAFVAAQDLTVSAAARSMARTAARTAAGEGPLGALVQRQQALSDKARELDGRLLKLLIAGDATTATTVRSQFDTTVADLADADRQLRSAFPDYANLISPASLTVVETQRRLSPDSALLMIVPAGDDLYTFALTREELAWSRLAGGALTIKPRVAQLRCEVDAATCAQGASEAAPVSSWSAKGYRAFDLATAYALYRDLVAPVERTFRRRMKLLVVTSGALAELPLALLPTNPPKSGHDDADPAVLRHTRWLGDRYIMTTLPAISVLRAEHRVADAGAFRFVGYGAPDFAGPDGGRARLDAFFQIPQPVDRAGILLTDTASLRNLSPLAGAEIELKAMMAATQAGPGALHLGGAATERSVRSDPQLAAADIIAFATHGVLPGDLGGLQEPGLAFTPPEKASPADDGLLTASEVTTLHLRADWVILSACNTASADGTPGADSLSSLSRAFLYAGAGALLASHWRVADDATAALTVEALMARKSGMTRGQALQSAMRAVRSGRRADGSHVPHWQDDWAHPGAWAPFVIIGADAS